MKEALKSKKTIYFYLDKGGVVQAAELDINGIKHCTADMRKDYQHSDAITLVTSSITVAGDSHVSGLDQVMRRAVEDCGYEKIQLEAELALEVIGKQHYDYHILKHPQIAVYNFN